MQGYIEVVCREKLGACGASWGLLFPDGRVAHNDRSQRIVLTTYADFTRGYPLGFARRVAVPQWSRMLDRLATALTSRRPYPLSFESSERLAHWLACLEAKNRSRAGWPFWAFFVSALVVAAVAAR
jgi:hypothetical protein